MTTVKLEKSLPPSSNLQLLHQNKSTNPLKFYLKIVVINVLETIPHNIVNIWKIIL